MTTSLRVNRTFRSLSRSPDEPDLRAEASQKRLKSEPCRPLRRSCRRLVPGSIPRAISGTCVPSICSGADPFRAEAAIYSAAGAPSTACRKESHKPSQCRAALPRQCGIAAKTCSYVRARMCARIPYLFSTAPRGTARQTEGHVVAAAPYERPRDSRPRVAASRQRPS